MWLRHAAAVAGKFGVEAPPPSLAAAAERGPDARRATVCAWARRSVIPKIREAERTWFCEQLALLNDEGLVLLSEVLPLHSAWPEALRWAPWGKTMWRFHRAWCVARITAEVPASVWGIPAGRLPEVCPLCPGGRAGLQHLLAECPFTEAWRSTALPS